MRQALEDAVAYLGRTPAAALVNREMIAKLQEALDSATPPEYDEARDRERITTA